VTGEVNRRSLQLSSQSNCVVAPTTRTGKAPHIKARRSNRPEERNMTPQERQMVADLFDRLGSLEGGQRDPDAERAMREGLARAPNAVYALVQTVLLQEEALKRANTRIEELEHAVNPGPAQTQSGGFLDSMRSVFAGQSRGSVPSVRTGGQGSSGQGSSGAWGTSPPPPPPPPGYQPQPGYPPPPGYMQGAPMGAPMMGGGGSFLGTAAATAAGVIGGSMLLNGIRGAFGAGGSHQTFGSNEGGGFGSSPGSNSSGGGELSREAGVSDIGRPGRDDPPARQDAWQDAQQQGTQQDDDNDYTDDNTNDAGDYSDDGGMDTA
jgi:uncharacterized protein